MGNIITVRLPEDLAKWLAETAAQNGVSQGSLIREELEKARAQRERPFLSLAGRVSGPATLSRRKGFSKE